MQVQFLKRFSKDLQAIRDRQALQAIKAALLSLESAENLSELSQIKAIEGHPNTYRLRVGNYRIGFRLENNTIIFVRVLHRREIYRYFP